MLPNAEIDVDAKGRLTMLLYALRSPTRKPEVNAELDARQHEVAKRLVKAMPGDPTLRRLLREADQSMRGH